jgi:hypothetical protein
MRFDRLDRLTRKAVVCLVASAFFTACGGRDSASKTDDASGDPSAAAADTATAADGAEPQTAAPAAGSSSAPLTAADIDLWEKGLAGELQAVHAAAAKLKSATTGEDTLSAMMGVQDMTTAAAGAKAAGVDEERYKFIRSNLSAAAAYLAPQLGGVDTTMLSPEQRAEMKRNNEAQLKQLESAVPADVVEALRPRAAELRKQDLELAGERLKSVGA